MPSGKTTKIDPAEHMARVMEQPLEVKGAYWTIVGKLSVSGESSSLSRSLDQWALVLGCTHQKCLEVLDVLASEGIFEVTLPGNVTGNVTGNTDGNIDGNAKIIVSASATEDDPDPSDGAFRKKLSTTRSKAKKSLVAMGVYDRVCESMGGDKLTWSLEDCEQAMKMGRELASIPRQGSLVRGSRRVADRE